MVELDKDAGEGKETVPEDQAQVCVFVRLALLD